MRRQLGELKDVYDREAATAQGNDKDAAVAHAQHEETRPGDIELAATDKGPRYSTHRLSPMEYLRKSLGVQSFDLEDNLEIEALEESVTHSLEHQVMSIVDVDQQHFERAWQRFVAGKLVSPNSPIVVAFWSCGTAHPDRFEISTERLLGC